MIVGPNHFTVITENLPATLDFYETIVGLERGPRPDLGFDGAWLYAEGRAILHVYADRPIPPGVAGVIDHMAFTARGLKETKARFDARGWKYDLRQQKGSGTWQLFSLDPSGAKVELDFDPGETL